MTKPTTEPNQTMTESEIQRTAGESGASHGGPSRELHQSAIVFFDGVCNICNQSVNTLLKLDRKGKLRYASLQGPLATGLFGPLEGDPDSMKLSVPRRKQTTAPSDRENVGTESRGLESKSSAVGALGRSVEQPDKAGVLVYEGYQAFLKVGGILYPFLKPLAWILSLPPFSWLGKVFYSWIAANRYRWFGKREFCDISNLRFKERFLD